MGKLKKAKRYDQTDPCGNCGMPACDMVECSDGDWVDVRVHNKAVAALETDLKTAHVAHKVVCGAETERRTQRDTARRVAEGYRDKHDAGKRLDWEGL